MLLKTTETMIDNGFILMLPDVPETASQDQLSAWVGSTPKPYKIRVVEPAEEELQYSHSYQTGQAQKTWLELDDP